MQEVVHYTTLEVAELYRVNTSTVRRWAEKKLIPAVKTPGRGEYRFPKAEIDDHLSSTSSQPEPKTAS